MTWTAERLDALPEGIVVDIEFLNPVAPFRYVKVLAGDPLPWACMDGSSTDSKTLLKESRGVGFRVVSVPIDALLASRALETAADAAWLSDAEGWSAEAAIRAAIAHVTGEAS